MIILRSKHIKRLIFVIVFISFSVTGFICDKAVTVSPPIQPPPTGFMLIKSIPAGAFIYLNGKNTGRLTPDSVTYLDYGTYQVTLRKKYFRDTTISVKVSKNVKIDTLINYLQNPAMFGSMNLTSDPTNSSVLLNDSATGLTTPVVIHNLIPGIYKVDFKKSGYRNSELNVTIESNQTHSANGTLKDTTIWVDYQVFDSGIPSQTLTCVAVDQNNVKWIGSSDSGLISYNEKTFKNYSTKNSPMPSNYIVTISVSPDNKIWIGTDNGLAIYDRSDWTIYNTANSLLPQNRVESIAFENTIVWVGTPGGLVKIDGSNWQVYDMNNSNLPWSWIQTVSVDQNGLKWLGVSGYGIFTFNNIIFQSVSDANLPSDMVCCSAVSQNNEIWFGFIPTQTTAGGLAYYNGNQWTPIYFGPTSIIINNLFIDNSNVKWVSTNIELVKIINYSPVEAYSAANSPLTSSDVTGSVKDKNGSLWITTLGGGLNKFKGAN